MENARDERPDNGPGGARFDMVRLELTSFDGWLGCAATLALALTPACAHQTSSDEQQSAEATRVAKLQSRLDELERTNGRLSVRIDEMEDEIFLLQDRVEAHRLALRRRGRMRSQTGQKTAQAPKPAPETHYGQQQRSQQGRYQVRGYNTRRPARRGQSNHPVRRIPLSRQQARSSGRPQTSGNQNQARPSSDSRADTSNEQGNNSEEIVITDEDFKRFAKRGQSQNRGSKSNSASTSSGNKRAKKRVTEEKLSTTADRGTEKPESTPSPEPTSSDTFEGKSGLDLYKSALAKYRSGEYATALTGFQAFLDQKPRPDYQDNGLYWIGECHFGMGQFEQAVSFFQRVLEEQPDGNKVPDSMLKMALAYRELGLEEKARGLLEKLTRRYPSTNAGRLGKKKLSDLES